METRRRECEFARSFARGIVSEGVSSFMLAAGRSYDTYCRGDNGKAAADPSFQRHRLSNCKAPQVEVDLAGEEREPRGLTPCSPANATCAWQGRRLAGRRAIAMTIPEFGSVPPGLAPRPCSLAFAPSIPARSRAPGRHVGDMPPALTEEDWNNGKDTEEGEGRHGCTGGRGGGSGTTCGTMQHPASRKQWQMRWQLWPDRARLLKPSL